MELAKMLGASATLFVKQLKHLNIAGALRCNSSGMHRAGRKVECWLSDRSLARCISDLERCLRTTAN